MADSPVPRRSVVRGLATGFVAFLVAPLTVAEAADRPQIRAGDPCQRVGRRRTVGGKAFECVNRDGMRQWRRVKQPARSGASTQPTTSGVKVLDSSALAVGASQVVRVTSQGRTYGIAVTRTSTGVAAFDFRCTHAGSFVQVSGANTLRCPAHGSEFNATTGAATVGPAREPLKRYAVSERSGAIYVTL